MDSFMYMMEAKMDVKLKAHTATLEKKMDERCITLEQSLGAIERERNCYRGSNASTAAGHSTSTPMNKDKDFTPSRVEVKGFSKFGEMQSHGLIQPEADEWGKKLKEKIQEQHPDTDVSFKCSAPRVINSRLFMVIEFPSDKRDFCWKPRTIAQQAVESSAALNIHQRTPYFVVESAPWRREKFGMMGKLMGILSSRGMQQEVFKPDWNANIIYVELQGRPKEIAILGKDNEWKVIAEVLSAALPIVTPEILLAETRVR